MAPSSVRRDVLSLRSADGHEVFAERSWLDELDPRAAPAVILCHGFVQNRSSFESPRRSLPEALRQAGAVVWVVEMRGRDGARLANGLHDYTDEDAPTILAAARARHEGVAWIGHSMGGLIGALTPASSSLSALVTLGSPLFPGPRHLHALGRTLIGPARAAHRRGIPFAGRRWGQLLWRLRRGLDVERVPAPVRLWAPGELDDEALGAMLRGSFAQDSHAVFADLLELLVTDARRAGRVPVSERLSALRAPLLVVAGGADHLAPPAGVRPLFERAASRDKHWLEVAAATGSASLGHIDLVVGDRAPALVWQPTLAFLRRHLALRPQAAARDATAG